MKVKEYQDKFRELSKTITEDIKNILAEHGITSINFDDIKEALSKQPFGDFEEESNELERVFQENVISIYYEDGVSYDCYITEIEYNNGVHFKAIDCFQDTEYAKQTSYFMMEQFYLYAMLEDFFDSFNYDDRTKLVTIKEK